MFVLSRAVILKKCNGSNTVEQIIRIISDMYPDIQRQVIANDVVKNLSVLSRFQLIEWKERNPFMKKLCVTINMILFRFIVFR